MSASFATLVARGARSSSVRQIVTPTFDEIVELFEPNVVSYWKFQDPIGATVTDEEGQENATITGAPELDIPTIVKFDTIATGAPTDGTCIAWPGTTGDFAQAANDAAHKTVAGTVVIYFQRDTASEKSQLIQADSPTTAGMAMGITAAPNSAPDAYIRDGTGTPINLVGGTGDVLLDRAYCLIFKWGTGGGMRLTLWNDTATLVRFATNPSTIGLSGNTAPIRFGATHTDTNHHDGPYARVIWMNRRITDAEEVLLAQAFSIPRSAASYRALELGMGPISLWGMGENSGAILLDEVGPRNGTYTGTVFHNAPDLPADSIDGAMNFAGPPGNGSGTVPHSTALNLPEFTLSFWFTPNHVPLEGEPALPLVCKTNAVGVVGNLACFLASNDGDVLRLRLRDETNTIRDISSDNGTIVVNQTYHVCIRGDNTGVTFYLNARFIGAATEHTIGLVNNEPLQFASGAGFAVTGDCILDEICLFARALTITEIAALAQRTNAPVTNADASTVLEGTVEAIDVIGNDSYVGIPTIEIMAPPGGGDSVAVIAVANTLPFVEYTAAAVGPGGAIRSFNYRITDVNGISNTTTCPVTVQDSGFVPLSIANCYTHTGSTIPVSNMAELEAAIDAANPGDQIVIADGTYAGGTRTFNPQGTAANPIVVRPVDAQPNHGRGTVVINEALWTLAVTSARLVITNIHFNNAQIRINGSHHRIARCQFRDIHRYGIVLFNSSDTRISHCDFSQYRNPAVAVDKGCIQFDGPSLNTNAIQRALVDYCHIHNIQQNAPHDPINPIQCGTAGGSWNNKCGIIFDHVFMTDIRQQQSSEFIVCKTSEVTFRYCTFTNMNPGAPYSAQYLQQRQGSGIEVRSCWLGVNLLVYDDVNVPAPVRNPLIIGNRMVGGADIFCRAGNDAPGQGGNVRPGPYHHCEDGRFMGNTMQSGHIVVGTVSGGVPTPYFPCRDNHINNVAGNPRRNIRLDGGNPYSIPGGALEVNTTFTDNTAADNDGNSPPTFTPAVQLDANDVGLAAPDPLCPSGPQN